MTGLQIKDFTAGYGHKTIIDNLSVSMLPRGKVSLLLGPNGSGKSTLLRSIAGLNKAHGQLMLDGKDLMQQSCADRAKSIVYLPQSLPEHVHLRALESVIVAQRASGCDCDAQCEQEALSIMNQLGIGHLALSFLDQLSGGQKQLVGLAQSLIRKPSLLLLDEPLSALDLNYQFHVMNLVRQETALRNIVTIVVVHDINIALRYADHVLMLKKGHLVADGIPSQVITQQSLAETYGVMGRIESCSCGISQVLIDGLVTPLV